MGTQNNYRQNDKPQHDRPDNHDVDQPPVVDMKPQHDCRGDIHRSDERQDMHDEKIGRVEGATDQQTEGNRQGADAGSPAQQDSAVAAEGEARPADQGGARSFLELCRDKWLR